MTEVSFKPVGLDRARLLALMRQSGLDGILLSSPENVFYATGYPALPSSGNPILYALRNQLPYFAFVGKDGRISLICWGPAAMGIEYGADDVRPIFMRAVALEELTNLINEKLPPGCSVGVESTCPFHATQLIQEHARPSRIVSVDDLMLRLRLVKSAAEIERIRTSTRIIEQTVSELARSLRIGMSRLELIQQAKAGMIQNGAHGVDHVTVAFGAANPEVALGERLERNQIVTLDLGAAYDGYVSDNRRLVYTGQAPDGLKQLHRKLCGVVADMGQALMPGTTFAALNARAYELYAAAGLEPLFLHVGHSIGLQVEECWISAEDQTPIAEGMVLNIELYSFSDEAVMIGDEETYVISGRGPERISQLPADLIEIEPT